MQDYWNDPPEEDDVPICCDTDMWMTDEGYCWCGICGTIIPPPMLPGPEADNPDDWYYERWMG